MEVDALLVQATGCPSSYEELYEKWRFFALSVVNKFLSDFPVSERVDIADTLISEFTALDYLNPKVEHSFTWYMYEQDKYAKFSTFFHAFCVNRLRNVQYHTWKSYACVVVSTDEDSDTVGVNPRARKEFSWTDFIDSLVKIKKALDEIPPCRSKNLSAVFLFMLSHIRKCGTVTVNDIAKEFRVTPSAVRSWLHDLSYFREFSDL